MQKSLREAANADVSDKDSSDPLSELDKQETLLRNINTKNKHIKRLLREIEVSLQVLQEKKNIALINHTATITTIDFLPYCAGFFLLLVS